MIFLVNILVETDSGQTDFGHRCPTDDGQTDFGQTNFGQTNFGPNRLWPKPTLAKEKVSVVVKILVLGS